MTLLKQCTFRLVPTRVVFNISFYHELEQVTNKDKRFFLLSLFMARVHKFFKQVLIAM